MDKLNSARMILCGIPLEESYLQFHLSKLMKEEKKSLRGGKIPIPDSYYLMGTADPTGSLKPDEVCVILYDTLHFLFVQSCYLCWPQDKIFYQHPFQDQNMETMDVISLEKKKGLKLFISSIMLMTFQVQILNILFTKSSVLFFPSNCLGLLSSDCGQISGKVLVYRNPGLHFGDIHVLKATYLGEMENYVGNSKYGIFFPSVGPAPWQMKLRVVTLMEICIGSQGTLRFSSLLSLF